MNYYKGHQGTVKVSTTGGTPEALAQVSSWTMTVEKQIFESTGINETYSRTYGGLVKGSGSVKLVYSAASSSAFIEAANTTSDNGTTKFELFISTIDNRKITFNGIITKASYAANSEEIATMTCDFVTTGAITLDL